MREIIEILLAQKAKIILIPNSIHPLDKSSDDYLFLNTFAQTYNLEILENISKSYTAYKERKIDICFAMRLHSIILSQVYDIPYIAFSYSKKTDEILKIIKK
jgi:polysaccharide pyruvyl transferase WcaK-like protein